MEIKEVINCLESLKKDAEDTTQLYPVYRRYIEALEVAIEAVKEKELSGAGTPKELQLINISR